MDRIRAEERMERIRDYQLGAGLVPKRSMQAELRTIEQQARGSQARQPIQKVDPRSPEGKALIARMGLPVMLVDKDGRPLD